MCDCPRNIVMFIRWVRFLMGGGLIQFQRTYREGNTVADFLTNLCFILQVHKAMIHLLHYQGKLRA